MVVIRPEEILMIERENRCSVIVTAKEHYSINKSLAELESILPEDEFYARINPTLYVWIK